eukprot:CAMPEP_0115003292 /NCGR_PEP_ID=MMETSP0216-20121206/18524_1 /TAXON_ID=223996 /ORGANISM="Protocruzia adherens, Strain Boccale" /LENGTH=108 /DNA_ID=CAMNT_0002369069 /DNA_START=151 /DNA_END=477 /DNA_ORIENTATION=+
MSSTQSPMISKDQLAINSKSSWDKECDQQQPMLMDLRKPTKDQFAGFNPQIEEDEEDEIPSLFRNNAVSSDELQNIFNALTSEDQREEDDEDVNSEAPEFGAGLFCRS